MNKIGGSRSKVYSPVLIERVRNMRKQGVLCKDIEKICGVNAGKISEWTKDLRTRKPSFVCPLELCEKAANLREQGKTPKVIAEILGIPDGHVVGQAIKKWSRYLENKGKDQRYAKMLPYVLNHPYALELHPDERKRYYEVVLRRFKNHPEYGYDYLEKAKAKTAGTV